MFNIVQKVVKISYRNLTSTDHESGPSLRILIRFKDHNTSEKPKT